MAVGTNIFASTGTSVSASTGGGGSASLASDTYGPAADGSQSAFSPKSPHGLGFWLAVGGVAVLVCIRQSLPR